jgi:hypothetical protein
LLEVDEDGEKAVLRRRRPDVRSGGERDWKREDGIVMVDRWWRSVEGSESVQVFRWCIYDRCRV